MEYKDQLKLQAYLDGELSKAEAREVADWVARDQSAAALVAELRQTRAVIADFGNDLRLPESREFFWSKIQREIQKVPTPRPAATPRWYALLRRFLLPASAVAFVLFVSVLSIHQPTSSSTDTSLADSGAVIFRDYSAGATFVWLSYPADKDIAELDEDGTFD